jgi:hypothetical protein
MAIWHSTKGMRKSMLTTMASLGLLLCLSNSATAGQDEVTTDLQNGAIAENGKNYSAAMEWYKKAADLGNSNAEISIGLMYETGEGVERDYSKAKDWYEKAKTHGDTSADESLLRIKKAEQDEAKNDEQNGTIASAGQHSDLAIEWYEKAAALGDTNAELCIGNMYERGEGVKQDYSKAQEWYQKAEAHGDINAKGTLAHLKELQDTPTPTVGQKKGGQYCANGDAAYMAKDFKSAIAWYRKSAAQGNSFAEGTIGQMYMKGLGVKRNYPKAKEWLEKAAAKGNKPAIRDLAYLKEIWNTPVNNDSQPIQGSTDEERLLSAAAKLESINRKSANLKSDYQNYAYYHPDDQDGIRRKSMAYMDYLRTHQDQVHQCMSQFQFYGQRYGAANYVGILRRNGYGDLAP